MQNRYLHNLSAEQLREAAEKNPDVTAMPLTTLYADHHAQNIRNKWNGMEKFHVDTNRQVKINGEHIRVLPKDDDYKQFRAMIHEQLKIDPEKINTSYAQDLMNLTMFPLSYNNEIGLPSKGTMYTPIGMDTNIYREGEDVYCKTIVKQYAVVFAGRTENTAGVVEEKEKEKEKLVINGPIEVLYKLVDGPQGGMFALQHMSTNSDFLRAAFLGEKGLDKQLERAGKTQQVLREIEDLLIKPPKQSNPVIGEAINTAFFAAMTAVGQYQQGRMSASQLVEQLEGQKALVEAAEGSEKKSFIRRHSIIGNKITASSTLEKAIETAKKLPCSEAAPAPVRIHMATSNKENVNASNVKESAEEPTVRIHLGPGR